VWVPRNPGENRAPRSIPEAERFYFLEEWYPKYGNLVPRDIATRAIHRIGVPGKTRHRRTAGRVFGCDAHPARKRWTASSKGFWRFTKVLRVSIRALSR